MERHKKATTYIVFQLLKTSKLHVVEDTSSTSGPITALVGDHVTWLQPCCVDTGALQLLHLSAELQGTW